MSTAGLIAALAVAFVAGGVLWSRLAVAWERTRRVLFDWKKGRRQQRTLRKMWRRYAGQTVQSALLILAAVVFAIWVITRGGGS